jgi:lipid-A-disaccharide synthase
MRATVQPNSLPSRSNTARKRFAPAFAMQPIYTGCIANPSNPKIFLSAGEASGDHYGAQLIAELRTRHPGATFFGLGGREMESAGQDRIVRAEDVAHMGITEVLRHAPRVYGSYRRLVASIKQRRPDIAILIDFPDVNFRLARELKKLSIPVVYFVSPQLWAWKRRRLRWAQERVDRMMVIFPFEETFYKARGVYAKFVGHPLAELSLPAISREQFAVTSMFASRVDPRSSSHMSKPWIALLPGSRWKEVELNLPTMLEAAALLGSNYDFLIPVASTIDKQAVSSFVFQKLLPRLQWPKSSITLVPDAREALHHAQASVVASGTATVQAAVIGNPFVVVYKVSPLTFRLAKKLIHYPPEIWASGPDQDGNLPIGMVNLIAGHCIVPELIQDRFTAANVASALHPLLADTPERARMIADLAQVRQSLQPSTGTDSIQQVCDAVDALLIKNQSVRGPKSPATV